MTTQPNPTNSSEIENDQNTMQSDAQEMETDQVEDASVEEHAAEAEIVEEVEEISEVDSLKQQLTEANDRWLRSQAELENVRRRARRDVEEQLKFANTPIVTDLLEVIENLDRAMEAGGSSDSGGKQLEGLMAGVKMVAVQFNEVLKKHGCQKIESTGQVFDPNVHEAVQMVPGEAANGTIVQELRSGYKLHDRVIRPAQVIVSSGPAS